MVGKKGQMRIQQMSFMLIGITLFFIIVGLFVLNIAFSGLKTSKANLNDQQATLLVQRLANSPELSCGSAFGSQMSDCIDMDKAMVLKSQINYYKNFWGVQGIEIRKLYPSSDIECTQGDYPNCGHLVLLNSTSLGVDKYAYVSLCRRAKEGNTYYNKCDLGELIIRTNG